MSRKLLLSFAGGAITLAAAACAAVAAPLSPGAVPQLSGNYAALVPVHMGGGGGFHGGGFGGFHGGVASGASTATQWADRALLAEASALERISTDTTSASRTISGIGTTASSSSDTPTITTTIMTTTPTPLAGGAAGITAGSAPTTTTETPSQALESGPQRQRALGATLRSWRAVN